MKKFENFINELYSTPRLNENDIKEMIDHIENYADKNGYDVYKPKSMDMSRLLPAESQKRITNEDPWGEEEWEIEKPKLMSSVIMLFTDASDNGKKILSFAWMTNGEIYTNDLYIDNSNFKNIDLKLLKQLI